ncbi:MAG: MGH1-like glycoside hydrolase domain-containing protein [Phycisphaeraceae bacterium]
MFLSPIGMTLKSGDFQIDRAFRLAIGDIFGNVLMYQSGIMDKPAPCLCAGLSYPDPWTRDAAFNTWSGAGLLMPEVMKNTLLSCLTRGDASAGMGEGCFDEKGSQVPPNCVSIAGQYWDRIIWAVGAWAWYRQNGDREFLALALEAIRNSLPYLEENEYDPERQLFRGGACIADGMGAYGDRYQHPLGSGIYHWPEANPQDRHPKGAGLPMMCMSTNCLYAEGYRIAQVMADELGEQRDPHWAEMRQNVIEGIRTRLWDEQGGFFKVYDDPWGGSGPHQECLGNCFALLFEGIPTPEQRKRIVEQQPHLAFGPPAVWPDYPRYVEADVPIESCPEGREDIAAENHILSQFPDIRRGIAGHGGAVWPLMMGIYGEAVLREGHADLFTRELHLMADVFCRAVQCPEIVHPDCGAPGGAVGEAAGEAVGDPPVIQRAVSCYRQTWSATSYLRLILHGLLGIDCRPEGLTFRPCLPAGMNEVELLGMPYRRASLKIRVERGGARACLLDGEPLSGERIPVDLKGEHDVQLGV